MEGKWAILNNDMIVVALLEGNLMEFDITSVERYGGEVKYSQPFEYRGIPTIGSVWSNELDKFI
jgi:hypothetical protein